MKYLQNRVATSAALLPMMAMVALVVWAVVGLRAFIDEASLSTAVGLGLPFVLFFASVYLMVEFSNGNALLRIRSRMVSSVFIVFSCCASFILPEWQGGAVQLCIVASLMLLFSCYQSPWSLGRIYYAFLFYGLATLFFSPLLLAVPFVWLLMATQLQAMNSRVLTASLFGLLTPYWALLPWTMWTGSYALALHHFAQVIPAWGDYASVTIPQMVAFAFVAVLSVIGIVHFWHNSFEDKTRIRLLYGFLISLSIGLMLWLLLQPQHFGVLFRVLVVTASPMVAHFFALTSKRLTNITFIVSSVLAFLVILFGLWMPSLSF